MTVSASPIVASLQNAERLRNERDAASTQEATVDAHHSSADPPTSATLQPNSGLPAPPPNTAAPSAVSTRAVQRVLTRSDRVRIVKWMSEEVSRAGSKHIASKAVRQFPHLFRGNEKANNSKASRLWKARLEYLEADETTCAPRSITRVTSCGFKRVYLKAKPGRGWKRSAWVMALQADLLEEFDRLRKTGLKFNAKLLRDLARQLIKSSTRDEYFLNCFDTSSKKFIQYMITPRWIQTFMERNEIVSRSQTGKLMVSPERQAFIEKEVAYHLGFVAREFRSGRFDEDDVSNADETHFVINMDNHRTLRICGEAEVKYSDVVSGAEGMTMIVRISGGRDARIEAPMMVFQNKKRSYPIKRVPDDVARVSYLSGPKGWMDREVMQQWLRERKVIMALRHGRSRVLYMENCSGHGETAAILEALNEINSEVRFFPPNCTDLLQPADSFVIQKLKDAWRCRWDQHKMERIMAGDFTASSGKLPNPGKHYFLELATAAVRDVNAQRDSEGLTYARKAKIRCGLALNTNGQWEERQIVSQATEHNSEASKPF